MQASQGKINFAAPLELCRTNPHLRYIAIKATRPQNLRPFLLPILKNLDSIEARTLSKTDPKIA